MKKKILYLDIDGVVADFDKAMLELCPEMEFLKNTGPEDRSQKVDEIVKSNPLIFEELPPFEGSVEAVNKLFEIYEVYFLSTPMWDIPESFMGKRLWLEKYFGNQCRKKLILTHRKDLVHGDYLVDDRLKNGAKEFKGFHLHFGTETFPSWVETLNFLVINK